MLVGHEAIRKVLGGMIDAKTQMQSRVVRAVTVGDVAQLYTDFEGTTDESGKTVQVRNKAIEVLHRQPDGSWKLIMGDPNARESAAMSLGSPAAPRLERRREPLKSR